MKINSFLTTLTLGSVILLAACNKDDEGTPNVTAPTVSATSPEDNDTNVARNQVVEVTFDEEMDATTLTTATFIVQQGTTEVAGAVIYVDKTATFTPTNTFDAGTEYTVKVTEGAKNAEGTPLEEDKVWSFTTGGSTSTLAAVDLGAASNYVILAKTAINNNPTSAITGDAGISPAAGSYVTGLALTDATGYATSSQLTGRIFAADMASPTPDNLTVAVDNMITAYNDAAGRPSPDFFELSTGNIGGKTLTPGLYKWTNTVTVPASFTISGGPGDVWIFQIAENLTVSSATIVTLSGGALAENIFWQVAGEVTIGTTAHFEGVIMSMTGITLGTGASLNGRALAQTAVILDSNVVTQPE